MQALYKANYIWGFCITPKMYFQFVYGKKQMGSTPGEATSKGCVYSIMSVYWIQKRTLNTDQIYTKLGGF